MIESTGWTGAFACCDAASREARDAEGGEEPVVEETFSTRRVVVITMLLLAVGALVELVVFRSWIGAASLTGAGAVVIINTHWLERLLDRLLQPGGPRVDAGVVLRAAARLLLLGVGVAVLVLVPQVDLIAVAIGVTAPVIALVAEGVRGSVGGG